MLEIPQYLISNYTTDQINKNSIVLAQKQMHKAMGTKDTEVSSHRYSHLMYANCIPQGKDDVLNKWCWAHWRWGKKMPICIFKI